MPFIEFGDLFACMKAVDHGDCPKCEHCCVYQLHLKDQEMRRQRAEMYERRKEEQAASAH